ncbi:MAG TPA: carboxylesterase/lipase family protein [Dongiaceae bacterium]|nr:carboxylesterase/lipase family protein [Dongiaceae bacterium]
MGFLRAFAAFLLSLFSAHVVAQSPQLGPVVHTVAGEVQGVALPGGVFVFRGVPFAAPPVGALRWREPQPVAAWQGVRDASRFGNACIQPPGLSLRNGGDPGTLSEDCLYLNVWTPRAESSANLPVLVWIHGGAFLFGSGAVPVYDGAPMAGKGAVVVTINYRLGALGFFAHPALERDAPGGPANFGLLDQIAALRWVQGNIRQFGGDAHNVTILGQSAGAKSVLALFASPLARGLFHKGVAMSSYALPDATRAKALEAGSEAAAQLGLPGASVTAEQLRGLPAEKFAALLGAKVSLSPVPVSGDPVLPRSLQDVFADGKEAPLPLILGNTSDDASVVLAFGINPAQVVQKLGKTGVLVKALYPGVKDPDELGRQVVRDVIFTMPVRWIADRHARRARTWRYYFDYTAVQERAKSPHGVAHGAEIVYMLDTVDRLEAQRPQATPADRDCARKASEYIFQFARTGKPYAAGAPGWQNDTAGQDRTLLFAEPIQLRPDFLKLRLGVFIGASKVLGPALAPRLSTLQ